MDGGWMECGWRKNEWSQRRIDGWRMDGTESRVGGEQLKLCKQC